MVKYKLIKEYPNSLQLGVVVTYDLYEDIIKNYPEFWEKVVELDYEVLSFTVKEYPDLVFSKNHSRSSKSSWYCSKNTWLSPNDTKRNIIHSIKRLNDGEIFTVGDAVSYSNSISKKYYIKSFEVVNPDFGLSAVYESSDSRVKEHDYIKTLYHVKKTLFTTEDGIDIFEGDEYWYSSKNFTLHSFAGSNNSGKNSNYKYFSVKEAAQEYIDKNKPQFSKKDMKDFANYCYNLRKIDIYDPIRFELWEENKNK